MGVFRPSHLTTDAILSKLVLRLIPKQSDIQVDTDRPWLGPGPIR